MMVMVGYKLSVAVRAELVAVEEIAVVVFVVTVGVVATMAAAVCCVVFVVVVVLLVLLGRWLDSKLTLLLLGSASWCSS